MSNLDTPESHNPPAPNYLLTVIASLVFILLFGIILYVAYVPTRPDPVLQADAEMRKSRLIEVKGKAEETLNSYGVVDPQNKVVRIPIELAMELTNNDIQNAQKTE